MISQIHVVFCAAPLLLIAVANRPCLAANDLSSKTLIQEYKNSINTININNQSIIIEGFLSSTHFKNGEKEPFATRMKQILYASKQGRERIIFDYKESNNMKNFERRVLVLGCERNFLLGRNFPQETYQILELITDSETKRSKIMFPDLIFTVDSPYALSFLRVPIISIIDSESFKFVKIEQASNQEQDSIRVVFDYRPSASESAKNGFTDGIVLRGWMIFEPEKNWAIREYEIQGTSSKFPDYLFSYSGMIRYGNGGDGFPMPEEVTFRATTFQSGMEVARDEHHFQAERLSTDPIPDSEFTLAAYGLGDVEQPPGAPTNTLPYWAFGFAIVAMAISVVLKRMARQA